MKGQSGQEKQLVTLILKYLANGPRLAMKHLYINRFRVSGPHRESYDVDPQVVILPLMTLDAAKAWTPDHEYSVAIVCSTAGAYKNQVGAKPIFNEYEREVGEADRDEMKHATDLLAAMVKAHAEIASGTRDGAVVSPIDLISKEEEKQKITALATSLGSGSVQIPVLTTTTGSKVLKVKLQNKYDYKIPDPMLLAMRAAINWYYIVSHGQKRLLPTYYQPPVDPEEALIEEMNAELYEAQVEEAHRPRTFDDLARGLHQWCP